MSGSGWEVTSLTGKLLDQGKLHLGVGLKKLIDFLVFKVWDFKR